MKENFNLCLQLLLEHEGGYVDHPMDPGGATNFGVTKVVYEKYLGRNVTKDEVKAMRADEVADIYKRKYWDKVRGDELPLGLDWCVFDFAVNAGVSRASKNLQKFISLGFKCFFWDIFSEIFKASFPDSLTIAMPEGPLPDESA